MFFRAHSDCSHYFITSHGGKKHVLPPVLPLGWVATTTKLTSSDAPWFLLEWARKIAYTFRIRIPYPGPVIVAGDPVVAREILNDPLTTKPNGFYGPIDVPNGCCQHFHGQWKHARKATAPAFSSSHIRRMNQVCKDKLEDWIQRRLRVFCQNDQAFDPAEEMLLLSLSIICEAAFEYDMKEDEAKFFVRELDLIIKECVLRQSSNPIRGTWDVAWLSLWLQ
jgi:cytochrome P450